MPARHNGYHRIRKRKMRPTDVRVRYYNRPCRIPFFPLFALNDARVPGPGGRPLVSTNVRNHWTFNCRRSPPDTSRQTCIPAVRPLITEILRGHPPVFDFVGKFSRLISKRKFDFEQFARRVFGRVLLLLLLLLTPVETFESLFPFE